MKLLEGKTPAERNKVIVAAVLGVVALLALYFAFGRSGGPTASATVKNSPTPKPSASPGANRPDAVLPTANEQDFDYQTTPVVYRPGNAYAPDPGRNIFAFYEPPPGCPGCTPYPTPKPIETKPPTPAPTPPIIIASYSPITVYAGSKGFRLELNGERFTPDAHIYLSQTELPTTFINAQKIVADVPAKFISQEGAPQIIVQTPDGKTYSNSVSLTVQAPPKPTFLYIGMIGRKRYNNDTAYFTDNDKSVPYGARLNDIIGGRFRLIDIAPTQVVLQDVSLGFKHRLPISNTPVAPGLGQPVKGIPGDGGFQPFVPPQTEIPGIPNNVQRYNPNQTEEEKKKLEQQQKQDVDDEGEG